MRRRGDVPGDDAMNLTVGPVTRLAVSLAIAGLKGNT